MKNKHWCYLKYIIKHKWYVMQECFTMRLYWRGLVHDLSKFLPSEWFPYAEYFYGEYSDIYYLDSKSRKDSPEYKKIKIDFDEAWLKHQHRNPHHWQYWILKLDEGGERYLDIPEQYLKEMAADWIGAGKAINGKNANVLDWYEKVKGKTLLSDYTRRWFEALLKGKPV